MQSVRRYRFDFSSVTSSGAAIIRLLPVISVLSGCMTDAELLAENSRIALQTAETRAAKELNCPGVKAGIVTKKEVPGQPLGELYSEYGIRVNGCGRAVFYDIECRDEMICVVREKPMAE
jgi:hypothetical protein